MTENGGGYVVKMPQPAQMNKAARWLGKASFGEASDMDVIVKDALDAGKIEVLWSYVQFDADALPVATRVAQVTSYGQHQGDPDRVTYGERFDTPTWRACRPGRRPTVFPTAEAAEATVEEHLAAAEHFNIPLGNLKMSQVVPVEEFEASLLEDPSDRIAQRVTQVELAVAKRKAENAAAEAAAIEAALKESKPAPSTGDWHGAGVPNVQKRVTADGATWYRGRVRGESSPTYATAAEATAWVEERRA
jgi:hypothetical protein